MNNSKSTSTLTNNTNKIKIESILKVELVQEFETIIKLHQHLIKGTQNIIKLLNVHL